MIGLSGPPLKTGLEWQLIAGFRTGQADFEFTFIEVVAADGEWTRELVLHCAEQQVTPVPTV